MDVYILSKRSARADLPCLIRPGDRCHYFGDDFLFYRTLRNRLPESCEIHLPGKAFHECVESMKAEVLELCHRIRSGNRAEEFWDTNLASRNSGSVPLIRQLAYYLCAVRMMQEGNSRLILVCESRALAGILRDTARSRGLRCHVRLGLFSLLAEWGLYGRLLTRAFYFLAEGTARWFYGRLLGNPRIDKQGSRPRFILRSWVTAGCVDGKGNYRDRNFGILPDYLNQTGAEVWIIPMYFSLDRNVFSQMKILTRCRCRFLFPEQYMFLSDVARTLRDSLSVLLLNLDGCTFGGENVGPLVREAHLQTSLSTRLLALNTVKYAIRRMAGKGTRVDRFIYSFENTAPEKPFLLACRRHYPGVPVIGFQHTVWYKEQFCICMAPQELPYHPLPDRIVVSGRSYLDILQKTGFPRQMLRLGPNLRYTSMNNRPRGRSPQNRDGIRTILLMLNFDPNQSLEFLEKAGAALQGIPRVRIYIKNHPLYPQDNLAQYLREIRFPDYQWADGTVEEWLARADVVMMTGGSVSNLETIVTGVPLIRVSLDGSFDFDSLWHPYRFCPFVHTPQEIRNALEKAFELDDAGEKELTEFGRETAESYFEPVTRERLEGFLRN